MTHRQARLPLISRLIASGCIVIWVAGVSACDLEALFCCESQSSETVAHVDLDHAQDAKHADASTNDSHNADTHHSGESDSHSHDSPTPDSKDGSCCSMLKAVAQTSTSNLSSKPVFLPIPFLGVPLVTQSTSLTLLESRLNRPVTNCERTRTPEVCLGPACQSNAPPAFR